MSYSDVEKLLPCKGTADVDYDLWYAVLWTVNDVILNFKPTVGFYERVVAVDNKYLSMVGDSVAEEIKLFSEGFRLAAENIRVFSQHQGIAFRDALEFFANVDDDSVSPTYKELLSLYDACMKSE